MIEIIQVEYEQLSGLEKIVITDRDADFRDLNALYDLISGKSPLWFAAYIGNDLVGAVVIRGGYEIYKLYVLPEFRGVEGKVGYNLADFAVKFALKSNKCIAIECADTPIAMNFWNKYFEGGVDWLEGIIPEGQLKAYLWKKGAFTETEIRDGCFLY